MNVLVVDWEKGAADKYATAVANTELIGRQTAVMLLDLIRAGANPKKIHIIGFSLGAHIAGCAGEMLKTKGYKIGRITGKCVNSTSFHIRPRARENNFRSGSC